MVCHTQAELRDFAWTEGELAGKRAQLAKSAHGSDNEQMTVFCFQTAVQAILWSKVAYTFLCASFCPLSTAPLHVPSNLKASCAIPTALAAIPG